MADERAAPKSKLILIVDDDIGILNLLEILVKKDGFRTILAETGDDAMALLQQRPDAVILDLMLPGSTTGIEVLRHLRTWKQGLPVVIVISGHSDTHAAVAEAKQDPNVAQFFPKPINQANLLELLHRLLRTKPPPPPPGKG